MQSITNPQLKTFKNLEVWQKARVLNRDIYGNFGKVRDFVFKEQICKASISIMNNIAEGYDRGSAKEFSRFLYYSKGSCAEVSSMLVVALDLGYVDQKYYSDLDQKNAEIARMLGGLIKSVNG
jgi:four helix bundle protein